MPSLHTSPSTLPTRASSPSTPSPLSPFSPPPPSHSLLSLVPLAGLGTLPRALMPAGGRCGVPTMTPAASCSGGRWPSPSSSPSASLSSSLASCSISSLPPLPLRVAPCSRVLSLPLRCSLSTLCKQSLSFSLLTLTFFRSRALTHPLVQPLAHYRLPRRWQDPWNGEAEACHRALARRDRPLQAKPSPLLSSRQLLNAFP